jgi:hypothetical protein
VTYVNQSGECPETDWSRVYPVHEKDTVFYVCRLVPKMMIRLTGLGKLELELAKFKNDSTEGYGKVEGPNNSVISHRDRGIRRRGKLPTSLHIVR